VTPFVLALLAATAGIGVLIAVAAWTTPPDPERRRRPLVEGGRLARLAGAAGAGVAALVGTGWLVAGLTAAVAGLVLVGVWQQRGRRTGGREQARIEGLAAWCEQLRDLLSADNGILGTINATVATCPTALRPEATRLATRLGRQAPEVAVRQFAAELDDPSGDLVASVILLATTHSGRTAELLSELAATIRERSTMRLRVEADRAGQRSEAKFVLGFGLAVIVGVLVFGRGTTFLDAYDTPSGQVVLAVVAALYGAGIFWLTRLTRFDRPARFLDAIEADGDGVRR
jgi:Flp pilus assembly protein TadB